MDEKIKIPIFSKKFFKLNEQAIYPIINENLSVKSTTLELVTLSRTASPDIEIEEIYIDENVSQIGDRFRFTNGEIKWINEKPVYVVKTDYIVNNNIINIYYSLFENYVLSENKKFIFNKYYVKIYGYYDVNDDLIEYAKL